ncbi:MAG: hypothetical protein ACRYG4_19795, partial [Janthinobacterium lividum]
VLRAGWSGDQYQIGTRNRELGTFEKAAGRLPVESTKNTGSFYACSAISRVENGGKSPFCFYSSAFTRQGSQVQTLSRPPCAGAAVPP